MHGSRETVFANGETGEEQEGGWGLRMEIGDWENRDRAYAGFRGLDHFWRDLGWDGNLFFSSQKSTQNLENSIKYSHISLIIPHLPKPIKSPSLSHTPKHLHSTLKSQIFKIMLIKSPKTTDKLKNTNFKTTPKINIYDQIKNWL